MRFIILFLMTLPLFSCVDVKIDDLKVFVDKTKLQIYPVNDTIPTLKKIDIISFTQTSGRNPFSEPELEIAAPLRDTPKSCPQPDFKRKKYPLEMYSLDNLTMRGTLFINDQLWALVQVSGGEIHKVKPGDHLGLNYGKVLKISENKIELLELASDKNGCWQERVTQITLQSK